MTQLDKVLQAIGTCREQGIATISTCNHSNWDKKEHEDMLILQANPPQDIRVDLKATHGVCDWTLIRIGETAAERPQKVIGTREDRMRTFGAYQHFLYYFDQALYEKEQPNGGMTHHFLRKLEMFRKIHSPEGCNTVKVLVEWVQGMTSNNQEDLLNWILKHHSNKW